MSEVGMDYKVSPRLHLNTYYDISFNDSHDIVTLGGYHLATKLREKGN